MKLFLLKILKYILRQLAQLTIWKYRPGIIGVTGSVGKTSTKYAIATVLKGERTVRFARGNFNNELGLPLTILGDWEEIKGNLFWIKVIVASFIRILWRIEYPEILILEYGVDRPGDMKYLLDIARPNVAVLTAIGEVPAHVEFFSGKEEVAREKARLIESLTSTGFAVLNHDDDTVLPLKDRTRAHTFTFGFGRGAMVQVASFKNEVDGDRPVGVSFKLEYGGSFVPVHINGVFGKTHGYAASAAAAVGIIFGMNLIKISESLSNYKSPSHRMELMSGIKFTNVIDDSYNASPLSMHAALHVLSDLPSKRKIAVLGDMLEIGQYAMEEHEKLGALVRQNANVLVAIGPRAKFIAEGARKAGMQKRSIFTFETADEAQQPVQDLIRKGDLILVKASHAMELEKIVEALKAF